MLVKNYIDQFTLCAFLVHDPQTSVLDGLVLRSVCDIFRIYEVEVAFSQPYQIMKSWE